MRKKATQRLPFNNPVVVRQYRDGKCIGIIRTKNAITNVGMNALLDVGFNGSSQSANWYMGLIDSSGYTAVANTDVVTSHTGWTESNAYTQSTRPLWDAGAANSRSITNASTVDFSINATVTLKGVFVINENTKGGVSTGTLWCTALFSTPASLQNGDTLKVTYTVSG